MEAVKQVDVVICAVASKQALDQKPLIHAIKRAGCIKVILFLHNFSMVLCALKWIHVIVDIYAFLLILRLEESLCTKQAGELQGKFRNRMVFSEEIET